MYALLTVAARYFYQKHFKSIMNHATITIIKKVETVRFFNNNVISNSEHQKSGVVTFTFQSS